MIFVTGAKGAGKLGRALELANGTRVARDIESAFDADILTDLQDIIRDMLESEKEAQPEILKLMEANPNIVICCDEIGCGIVPMNPIERIWRDETGRLCCIIARNAEIVERLICGIPNRIKG